MSNLLNGDDFFSKSEAATYLNMNTRTLDRRNAEGIGPPRVKHGNKIGYFKSSLDIWLRDHESKPGRSE